MGLPWDEEASTAAPTSLTRKSEVSEGEAAGFKAWDVPGVDSGVKREPSEIDRGVTVGLKKGLVPWAVTKEEYNRPTSVLEAVTEGVANLASGVATGAALGSVLPGVGTLSGAVVGAITYGLYSGIGTEVMRSRAKDEDFNLLRAAAGVALETNPLIKASSKISAAVRTLGQIGGGGALEYSYTGDMDSAKYAALAGAVFFPFIYRGMKPSAAKVMVPDAADNIVKMFRDDTGAGMLEKATAKLRAKPPEVSNLVDPDEGMKFSRWFLNDFSSSDKDISKAIVKRTPKGEALDKAYTTFKFQEALVEEAGAAREQLMTKFGFADPLGSVQEKFVPVHFVGRTVDKATGLNTSGLADSFSKAKDAHNVRAAAHLIQAEKAKGWQDLAKISNVDMGKALAGQPVSAKVTAALATEEGKNAANQWRKVMDTLRLDIQDAGYDIGYLANYVPMKSLQGLDLYQAVQDKVSKLNTLSMVTKKSMRDADPDLYKELVDLTRIRAGVADVTDKDILNLPQLLRNVKKNAQGYELSAVMERKGTLPEWQREYDIGKVFAKYIATNLKAIDYDPAFKMLNANVAALDAAGMTKSADYFRAYSKHMSGDAGWLPSLLQSWGDEIRLAGRKIQGSDSRLAQQFGKAAEAVPDFVGWLNTQWHPAFLGLNAKASIRNLSQVYQTTAPEIGGKYGYKLTSRSVLDAVKSINEIGGLDGAEKWLKAKGQLGDITKYEVVTNPNQLSSNLRKYTNTINDITMAVYNKTDTINRFITMKIGERWASDLIEGNPAAFKALKNLGSGAKAKALATDLLGLIEAGNKEKVADQLGDWLITKTQFRYGREQQSFFNREAGPLLSAFTTWPQMVGSDVVDAWKHQGALKGSLRNAQKYAAPLLALYAAQSLLSKDTTDSAAYKYMIDDLTELSPTSSLANVFSFGGPALRMLGEAPSVARAAKGSDLVEKAGGVAKKVAQGTVKTFVPGVSSITNELDRMSKAHGFAGPSEDIDWYERVANGELFDLKNENFGGKKWEH